MSQGDIRALIEKSKESLAAARTLLAGNHHDFAASRAYYAMFYAAEALLLDRGESYSKHAAVIAAFGREFAKTGILDTKYHRWLIDAQDLRNIGDYGVGTHVQGEQAESICAWAEEFIGAAEEQLFRGDPEES